MSGLRHETTLRLRWRDIDTLGHLNQSVYHELLEEARAGLLGAFSERVDTGRFRGGFVVAHVDLDYHGEVRREDGEVRVLAEVDHVGASSVRIAHEVRLPDGTLVASGSAVIVAWDGEARAKRRLDEAERAALEAGP